VACISEDFGFSSVDFDSTSVDLEGITLELCCFSVGFWDFVVILVVVDGSSVVGGGGVGQASVLQGSVSSLGPSFVQSFPPCSGTGLVHLRPRELVPPPQVTEQSLNVLHSE
jgi:hypothetical protein